MPATPFRVKAVFEYKSEEPDDLKFLNGQIITVTEEEDEDWYNGEYVDANGARQQGIFPKNFVEKYEPAIPSRPTRQPKRAPAPDSEDVGRTEQSLAPSEIEKAPTEPVQEAEIEPPAQMEAEAENLSSASAAQRSVETTRPVPTSPPPAASKPAASRVPPPVAEKPSGNSFKDRIAAFNKPAAAPITPFKPAGQSSNFIKKPFVAPPPSKNAYVPPPREQPPQKIYRREEDAERDQSEATEPQESFQRAPVIGAPEEGDQAKPTSLKDRIALLQKQQLEQAARQADSTQKKEKPKKPPKTRRTESSDKLDQVADSIDGPLEKIDTNETIGKKSVDFADDEAGPLRGHQRRKSGHAAISTPPPPSRELVSDTNDADDSGAGDTEDPLEMSAEEDRPEPKRQPTLEAPLQRRETRPNNNERPLAPQDDEDRAQDEIEEEDEEEDEDPEVRRRRELRDRMAKMSGGMGMMGMFGTPGGAAAPSRKPKPSAEYERPSDEVTAPAPPIPIMALPGMSNIRQSRQAAPLETESDDEDTAQHTPEESTTQEVTSDEPEIQAPPKRTSTERSVPPVPVERSVPPPPARESRPPPPLPPIERAMPTSGTAPQARAVPPPPPFATQTYTPEEDSEEEAPRTPSSRPESKDGPITLNAVPPVPSSRPPPNLPDGTPTSPTSPSSSIKRTSRAPPPLPPSSPISVQPQTRAPPPPPPGQPPSRSATLSSQHSMAAPQNDSESEASEYDGDYDTDIASSAKHKDALKSHYRDSSLDEAPLTDDGMPSSPPPRAVPPVPPPTAPRDVAPPLMGGAPKSRKSTDAPRAAPPPVPPPKEISDEDYDPYRYSTSQHGMASPPMKAPFSPNLASPQEELEEQDMYSATPPAPRNVPPPPNERPPPTQPSMSAFMSGGRPLAEPARPSMDIPQRTSTQSRRSMEQPRPTGEHGFIASDIDLGQSSMWWTQENNPPPALQNRPDVSCEFETSTSTKRGGRATVSRDVYVLYIDYSQSTINANFDASDPSHVTLEQTHQRPPAPLRQDQLEQASMQFGARLAETATSKLNTTVGDGSAHAYILDLLTPLPTALKPIGTKAYGALVYANLANATSQQHDEIRSGDIVTFRNAKFSGHRGGLHSSYKMDVGLGGREHVGVVTEWDGTKKKIRVLEQKGGDEKSKRTKVREESYKVGDLKSGEVRVWRVMGRAWVGWDK